MTRNKASSRRLLWMVLVFFSVPDQNKDRQGENPVLPHSLARCSSQVALELPTALGASPKLSAASRKGETEPQGSHLDFFCPVMAFGGQSSHMVRALMFYSPLGRFLLTTACSHYQILASEIARAGKLGHQRGSCSLTKIPQKGSIAGGPFTPPAWPETCGNRVQQVGGGAQHGHSPMARLEGLRGAWGAWQQGRGCRGRDESVGSPAPARQLIKMQSGHPRPVPTVSQL